MLLCPKCSQEILESNTCQNCERSKNTSKLGKGSKLTSRLRSSKLRSSNRRKSWLPAFLANSFLGKIKVNLFLVAFLVLSIPAFAWGVYLFFNGDICISCSEIGGSYKFDLPTKEHNNYLDIDLFQYGNYFTGAVQISSKTIDSNVFTNTTLFIDTTLMVGNNISFSAFSPNNSKWVKFTGQIENGILSGKLESNISELNANQKPLIIYSKNINVKLN